MRHGRRRATETDVEALAARGTHRRAGRTKADGRPGRAGDTSPSAPRHEDVALHLSRRLKARHVARCRAFRHHFRPHELSDRRRRRHDQAEALAARPDRTTRMPRHGGVASGRFRPCRVRQHVLRLFRGAQEDVVLHVLPGGMEDFKNYRFHSSQIRREPSRGRRHRAFSRQRHARIGVASLLLGATRSKSSNRSPCASR